MLAYYYPPSTAVAIHRPEGLCRHLPAFGWTPVMITPERAGSPAEVIQTPDRSFMRVLEEQRQRNQSAGMPVEPNWRQHQRWHTAFVQSVKRCVRQLPPWHDEYTGWSFRAINRAVAEGRQRKVDLVWATCNPFSLAPAALRIARALGVPCVVDLRDTLPSYLYLDYGAGHWFFQAMQHVDAVTLSAPSNAHPLLHAVYAGRPMYHILSGSWLAGAVPLARSTHFRLVHAGSLYGGQRNPQALLRACAELSDELPTFRRDARLCFIGPDADAVRQFPEYAQVGEICELVVGQSPAQQVQARLAEASVLLIINGGETELCDTVPAKLYELLCFDAPILSLGGVGGMHAELLRWCGCGRWTNDAAAMRDAIREWYLRWQVDGTVCAPRNPEATAYLTQARMAGEFAEVFSAVVEQRPVACRPAPPWQAPTA